MRIATRLQLVIGLVCCLPLIGHAETAVIYSGPGDGTIHSLPWPGTWEAQRTNTSVEQLNYDNVLVNVSSESISSNAGYLSIKRAYFSFDTSVIPDDAEITAATLYVHPQEIFDEWNDEHSYINVYRGHHASSTAIIADDFDTCGETLTNPTPGSEPRDITSLSASEYSEFPLTADGLSWISKSDFTKLCMREGHDVEDIEPINNSGVWKSSMAVLWASEAPGTSTDPYLEITYTLPGPEPSHELDLDNDGSTDLIFFEGDTLSRAEYLALLRHYVPLLGLDRNSAKRIDRIMDRLERSLIVPGLVTNKSLDKFRHEHNKFMHELQQQSELTDEQVDAFKTFASLVTPGL